LFWLPGAKRETFDLKIRSNNGTEYFSFS
jgi:hypothetical protein